VQVPVPYQFGQVPGAQFGVFKLRVSGQLRFHVHTNVGWVPSLEG
jgi:hypothetical protein